MLLASLVRSPADGARTAIHLASSDALEGTTGEYFADQAPARTSARARDPDLAARLWDTTLELVE